MMLDDWHRARAERAPDPEPPWWVTEALRTPILPEPEIVPEPTIGDGGGYHYDEGYYYDEDEEVQPADAGAIAARLEELNREQLVQVAEVFSESTDGDEAALRQRLLAYIDETGADAVSDAEGDEGAREAGRAVAIENLTQEIASAMAAPAGEQTDENRG
jgi:hypothetical protein